MNFIIVSFIKKSKKSKVIGLLLGLYLLFQYWYIFPTLLMLLFILKIKELKDNKTRLLIITCIVILYIELILLADILKTYDILSLMGFYMARFRISMVPLIDNLHIETWIKVFSTPWNYNNLENFIILLGSIIGLSFLILKSNDSFRKIILSWILISSFQYLFLKDPHLGARLYYNIPLEILCAIGIYYTGNIVISSIPKKLLIFCKISSKRLTLKIPRQTIIFIFLIFLISFGIVVSILRLKDNLLIRSYVPPDSVIDKIFYLKSIMTNNSKYFIFLVDYRYTSGVYYDHLSFLMYNLEVRVRNIDIYIGSLSSLLEGEPSLRVRDYPIIWNNTSGNTPRYDILSNPDRYIIITIMTEDYSFYKPVGNEYKLFEEIDDGIYTVNIAYLLDRRS